MPDAVLLLDSNSRVIDLNSAAVKMSGLDTSQLMNASAFELAKVVSPDSGKDGAERSLLAFPRAVYTRALSGEEVQNESRTIRNIKTGVDIELLVSAKPIRNIKGETLGALIVARDVTELHQLQRRLSDIERHQAIGHVAAGIAHDFNNTLQTISQAVAVLRIGKNQSEAERSVYLGMIDTAVRRGAEVIARIRDYLGTGTSEAADLDLITMLEDAIELTRPMWQAAQGVEVSREFSRVSAVRANAPDLRRVFTNLIINALQAMPNGGRLTIGCDETERWVHCWVGDTGQGIAPENRKKIFNPYFTTKPQGTGLGLSGAQKIILSMGGTINFQSQVGQGTTFHVYLPKASTAEKKEVRDEARI